MGNLETSMQHYRTAFSFFMATKMNEVQRIFMISNFMRQAPFISCFINHDAFVLLPSYSKKFLIHNICTQCFNSENSPCIHIPTHTILKKKLGHCT